MISTNIVQTGFKMSGVENASLSTGSTEDVSVSGTDFSSFMNSSDSADGSMSAGETVNQNGTNVETMPSCGEKVKVLFTSNNQSISGEISKEDMTVNMSTLIASDTAVVQLIQQVMEVIQSETGCSQEELLNAMNNIGAEPTDLVSLDTVKNIVLELNGLNTPQELLTNQKAYMQFVNIMEQVKPLTENFSAMYEFTPEQSSNISETIKQFMIQDSNESDMYYEKQTEVIEFDKAVEKPVPDEIIQTTVSAEKTGENNVEYTEKVPTFENPETAEKTENNLIQDAESVPQEIVEEVVTEPESYNGRQKDTINNQNVNVITDESKEDMENVITSDKTQNQPEANQNNNSEAKQQNSDIKQNNLLKAEEVHTADKKNVNNINFTAVTNNLFEHISESVSDLHSSETSQTSFATRIFNQVMEGIKVLSGEEMSSMEMQLQPENLGKLNIQVVSKNGIITAQIITQSEAVKQAIESQMFVLKENMNNHDIAIEDVEVTVSSHAFEQAMDNGSHENSDRQQKRRNFVSEDDMQSVSAADIKAIKEEILEEAMKEQSGSTVSYTA